MPLEVPKLVQSGRVDGFEHGAEPTSDGLLELMDLILEGSDLVAGVFEVDAQAAALTRSPGCMVSRRPCSAWSC